MGESLCIGESPLSLGGEEKSKCLGKCVPRGSNRPFKGVVGRSGLRPLQAKLLRPLEVVIGMGFVGVLIDSRRAVAVGVARLGPSGLSAGCCGQDDVEA